MSGADHGRRLSSSETEVGQARYRWDQVLMAKIATEVALSHFVTGGFLSAAELFAFSRKHGKAL